MQNSEAKVLLPTRIFKFLAKSHFPNELHRETFSYFQTKTEDHVEEVVAVVETKYGLKVPRSKGGQNLRCHDDIDPRQGGAEEAQPHCKAQPATCGVSCNIY